MQPGEEIESLVDELEQIVNEAKSPLMDNGQKKIVDAQDVYEILDEIRRVFPQEFSDARRILKEEQEMLDRAQQQANSIIADAQQQAIILAGDQEVVRIAQQQAEGIRDQAAQYERDTRYNAEEYADTVLAHLEENLKSLTSSVSRVPPDARRELRPAQHHQQRALVAAVMKPLPFVIDDRLAAAGDTCPLAGHLDESGYELGDHEFSLPEGIDYDLVLTNAGEGILATGLVRAHVVGTCDRCLEDAEFDVAGEVDGYYLFEEPERLGEDEDEADYELVAPDNTIDLSVALLSALVMDTPFVVLWPRGLRRALPGLRCQPQRTATAVTRPRSRRSARPSASSRRPSRRSLGSILERPRGTIPRTSEELLSTCPFRGLVL